MDPKASYHKQPTGDRSWTLFIIRQELAAGLGRPATPRHQVPAEAGRPVQR